MDVGIAYVKQHEEIVSADLEKPILPSPRKDLGHRLQPLISYFAVDLGQQEAHLVEGPKQQGFPSSRIVCEKFQGEGVFSALSRFG